MSFLDRFKPQPKWRHADPAVRANAVSEVPDDDEHRAVLLELASEDPDQRVRRAAASRLAFAEDLVRLARATKDDDLRRSVTERLVALASAPSDDDGEAALALEGLDDQRHLSTVAKESPHDTVRTAALGRVHDVRALGSVARHASAVQTALEAVTRIADQQELINVALKTDHKEVGLAALERASASADGAADWRQTLETLATRAKNKAVARQARALVQAIEQAEAAERAALEAWRQRLAGLIARIEASRLDARGSGQRERARRGGVRLARRHSGAPVPDRRGDAGEVQQAHRRGARRDCAVRGGRGTAPRGRGTPSGGARVGHVAVRSRGRPARRHRGERDRSGEV